MSEIKGYLLTTEEANHITEKEVDMYNDYDYVVRNKKLADLKTHALEIVRDEENYEGGLI